MLHILYLSPGGGGETSPCPSRLTYKLLVPPHIVQRPCPQPPGSREQQTYTKKNDMPPKLSQVALDVQFLYQPLQIILYNFTGLVQLFESLKTQRQLNQFVTQALPIIVRTCTEICGPAYQAPGWARRAILRQRAPELAPKSAETRIRTCSPKPKP